MEEYLHNIVNTLQNPLFHLVGRAFRIHSRNGYGILRTDDAHLFYLLVKGFIRYQKCRFGVAQIGFLLQLIPLCYKFGKRPLLLVHHHFRTLDDWGEYAIHCAKHYRREKHNAKTNHKGT